MKKWELICFFGALVLACSPRYVVPPQVAVMRTKSELQQLSLINLQELIPTLKTDWVYASRANFTGQVLYRRPLPYLQTEAAMRLKQAQDSLQTFGLGLVVYDAYRPYRTTQKMWQIVGDERYTANPAQGSNHNRAMAIDVGLIELKTGKRLAMPTQFDTFNDTAHHHFSAIPAPAFKNRQVLKGIMESAGFKALDTEWWHYTAPNAQQFSAMDFSFKQLQRHFAKKNRQRQPKS